MEGKKSFLLYSDLKFTVDKLTDSKAGELFKHILKYVNDENPETTDIIIEIAFEPIKQGLKRDLQRWSKTCERNKINGSKGGRPINPLEPKKPTGLIDNPLEPKKPDNDNDNDNEKKIICLQTEFVNQLKKLYPKPTDWEKDQLNKFYTYWIEPNKSRTKIKWQMQKTWDLQMRVSKWLNNAEIWEAKNAK